jgi:hypothetical protein
MKRMAVFFTVLLMVAPMQLYAVDQQHMMAGTNMPSNMNAPATMEPGKTATVRGEIVDLGCYLSSGAKGKDHQGCAQMCINNGMPMGLLTNDGALYLLTMNHSNADPYNQAKKWAADQVEVIGPYSIRNGFQAIEVDQVKQVTMANASN